LPAYKLQELSSTLQTHIYFNEVFLLYVVKPQHLVHEQGLYYVVDKETINFCPLLQ